MRTCPSNGVASRTGKGEDRWIIERGTRYENVGEKKKTLKKMKKQREREKRQESKERFENALAKRSGKTKRRERAGSIHW